MSTQAKTATKPKRTVWEYLKMFFSNMFEPSTDVDHTVKEMLTLASNIARLLTIMIASAFASIGAYFAMSTPGGIAGATGQFLARVCLDSGYCDFNQLMGGFAMANIWLIGLTIAFLISLLLPDDNELDEDHLETLVAYTANEVDEIKSILNREFAQIDDIDITEALRKPTDAEIEEGV